MNLKAIQDIKKRKLLYGLKVNLRDARQKRNSEAIIRLEKRINEVKV